MNFTPHPLLRHSNQDSWNEWGMQQILQNAYTVSLGKPKQKRPPGRPRQRWEDNIKMDLKEMGWDCVDWAYITHDKDKWQAVVNKATNLLYFTKQGIFWLDQKLSASQEGLCSMQLVQNWTFQAMILHGLPECI